jgi:hypothetical protein
MSQSTAYKIVNPAKGNDYFDTSGTATGASNQPEVNTGRAKNLGSNRTLLNHVAIGRPLDSLYGSRVLANKSQGAFAAYASGAVSMTGFAVASSGGFCGFTRALPAHGVLAGDILVMSWIDASSGKSTLNTIHNVTSVNGNDFTTDVKYQASTFTNANTPSYKKLNTNYTYATTTVRQYVMRKGSSTTNYIAGVANQTLRSGASDFGQRRSIHKRESVYDPGTATAIRAGYWSIYTGKWTTAPTPLASGLGDVAGNTASGNDDAATPSGAVPGELVYVHGSSGNGIAPVQDQYKARTLW